MVIIQGIIIGIVGAYLGMLADRFSYWFHVSRTMLWRKRCTTCFSIQGWITVVPVLGFIMRRGVCITCNERLPVAPVVAELGGALALGGAWLLLWGTWLPIGFEWVHAVLVSVIVWGVLVLAISDFVYDEVPFPVYVVTLATVIARAVIFIDPSVYVGVVVSGLIAGVIMALLGAVSRWQWVQVHDILFGVLIGCLVGLPGLFVTLALAYMFAVFGGIISWGWDLKMWKGVSRYGLYLFVALAVQGILGLITLFA